jgi:hypothetical protein
LSPIPSPSESFHSVESFANASLASLTPSLSKSGHPKPAIVSKPYSLGQISELSPIPSPSESFHSEELFGNGSISSTTPSPSVSPSSSSLQPSSSKSKV